MARLPARYRPRLVHLRDGRVVTLRAIEVADAPEIVQAFERLDQESRYSRFMQDRRQLDPGALARGVNPQRGQAFTFVATVPAPDGIDIVGAAQYVRADAADPTTCEFAITVAADWRGSGLAARLLASLIRRARRDEYVRMIGLVIAGNSKMLALARQLKFTAQVESGDASVVHIERNLQPTRGAGERRNE